MAGTTSTSIAVATSRHSAAALGRRTTLSAAFALALFLAAAPSPPGAAAFENDRDMLEDHTPETAFIFATIRAHTVVIFSKSYCPYCRAVKKIFAEEYPEVRA
jgi:glutaredoxin 3